MSKLYTVHPTHPQPRILEQVVTALRGGGVLLYPTDTSYALGCDLFSKSALERVRKLKQRATGKPLTFLCPSLADIARYAQVTDSAYRVMRSLVPGPYTFILPATKLVPQLVQNPKRKTVGIRVPDHPLCQALLAALGNPILSTSARLPEDAEDPEDSPLVEPTFEVTPSELLDGLMPWVDGLLEDGSLVTTQNSTILDLTGDEPQVLRRGLGWERVAHWES